VELSREYFKWAHHDDVCVLQSSWSVEVLDCNPSVVLCYPKTIIINEHGQHIENYGWFNLRSSKPHERFEQYHKLIRYGHRCHPFHGMIRANTLKATSLVGSYPSSDLVL